MLAETRQFFPKTSDLNRSNLLLSITMGNATGVRLATHVRLRPRLRGGTTLLFIQIH